MAAKKIVNPVVAIVGATGAVGVELLRCLEQRKFPLKELKLFASARSAGKTMKFRGKDLPVQELTEASFAGVDIGLFSAGSGTTKKFAPAAVKAGTVIVDNSSAFRMDPGRAARHPRDQRATRSSRTRASSRTRTAPRSSRSRRSGPCTGRTASSG